VFVSRFLLNFIHSRYHILMSQIHGNLPTNLAASVHHDLPQNLYFAIQVKELDRIAIDEEDIPGLELMERAGTAAFSEIRHRWPKLRVLGVLCGAGNNGGDGFVVARLAHEAGYNVTVWQLGDCDIGGDAYSARELMETAGLHTKVFDRDALAFQEILVDGLLGTGLNSEVKGQWRETIEAINKSHEKGARVLALDIPSGLHADTGNVLGTAVHADCCATFIGLKLGLFVGQGPDVCGALAFDDLGVPPNVFDQVSPAAKRMSYSSAAFIMSPRQPTANKGHFGHVLVVGGELGMSGAARLAGEAAARTGAGLVSIATRKEHAAVITAAVPELMCHGVDGVESLMTLLHPASVLAIGCGLGRNRWGQALFSSLQKIKLPLVMDADALNLLAINPTKRENWILTPHPGEAARLLGQTVEEVQSDRVAAAIEIQKKFGGVVVLKGAGTVVVDAEEGISICSDGNPGMATGGMGDVLTGVIAGLLAQGLPLNRAAQLGVCLHARAGDLAAEEGQRGLLASDLFPFIRRLLD
jgi:NAD(P)H-hydrate epimerase